MAYDIRGRIPADFNEELAHAIARAFAAFLGAKRVVVGHDIRLSSPGICDAVTRGLAESGVEVAQIGECGTEEVYFATDRYGFDGGVMVTASHNPKDYNGMKLVREKARPISADSGLQEIRQMLAEDRLPAAPAKPGAGAGKLAALHHRQDYVELLLGQLDIGALRPCKIVVNPGNGGASLALDALEPRLPQVEFVKVHYPPDGSFPNGVPNPLLPENRAATSEAVKQAGADLGLAWDGDFDRCFFFDERGRFIEGYYIVGLLAQACLQEHPGAAIVHDPRLVWNTEDIIRSHGGRAVLSKAGHAFMKESMAREGARYGGEMSGHHFFGDFAYCDSGMIPWLRLLALMSRERQPLSALVEARLARYPASGEINRRLADPEALLEAVEARYASEAQEVAHLDGLSMAFAHWRFNLRASNTEPVLRLNVESRADPALMQAKTKELLAMMDSGRP